MSIQDEIKNLLQSTAAGGAWGNAAPAAPTLPYITYSRTSVSPQNTLDGASNLRNTRLQISVWSGTYDEAQSIATAVKTQLDGWGRKNLINLEQDYYDPDMSLHCVRLNVSVWHS